MTICDGFFTDLLQKKKKNMKIKQLVLPHLLQLDNVIMTTMLDNNDNNTNK